MNRIFRLVFNRALGQVQVVSELACRARNGVDARPARLPLPAGLAIALLFAGGGAWAQTLPAGQLPTGESVRHGSASFDRGTANLLQIMQNGRTVIDWTAFDIGTGAKVDFVQSAGSIALNRVTGGSVSQILGALDASAGVFLINPSGIVFGAGSQVNVGSLMASTLGLGPQFDGDTRDPLLRFYEGDHAINLVGSAPGAVVNYGDIRTRAPGGSISLVGGSVFNGPSVPGGIGGTLRAEQGAIHLVGAGRAEVVVSPTHQVTAQAASDAPPGASALVENTGRIQADGGSIRMIGAAAPGLVSSAVNTSGVIFANSLGGFDGQVELIGINADVSAGGTIRSGGGVSLVANRGEVSLSGTLDSRDLTAIGTAIRQTAGRIHTGDTRLTAASHVQGGVQAGDISLTSAGNVFGGTTFFHGRDVTLAGSSGLHVGGGSTGSIFDQPSDALRATRHLSLDMAGAITQAGAISVGGTTSLDAGGAITWTDAGNRFDGAVTLASGGAAALSASGALTLAAFDHQNLSVSGDSVTFGGGTFGTLGASATAGDIRQTGALSVSGASRFEASGAIGLGLAGNAFGGQVSLDSGGQATVRTAGDLSLAPVQVGGLSATGSSIAFGGGNIAGALTATATGGSITQTGALSIAGTATLDATGAVALDLSGNGFGGAVDVRGAGITLRDADDLTISRLDNIGSSAVSLTAGGSLVLPSAAIGTGSNALTLWAGNTLSTSGALDGGTVQLHGGTALNLAHDVAAANALMLSSGGAVSQVAGALRAPLLTLSAGSAALTGSNAISGLGNVDVDGPFSLHSTNTLIQRSSTRVRVGGATTFHVDGLADLGIANIGNTFGGTVSLTGRNTTIRSDSGLRFGVMNVASLAATAPELRFSADISSLGAQIFDGAVILDRDTRLSSQFGEIFFASSVDGPHALGIDAPARGVRFNGPVGQTRALASLNTWYASAATVRRDITVAGDVVFGTLSVIAPVTVRSQAGNITTGTLLGGSPIDAATLTLSAAGNVAIGAAGTSSALRSLTLAGNAVSTGAIRVDDALTITARDGGIAQGGAYTVGGASRFDATADIALGNALNSFGGDVSLTGANAVINAASALRLNGIDVASLTANSSTHALSLRDANVAGGASLTGAGVTLGGFGIGGDLDITSGAGGIVFGDGRVDGNLLATGTGAIRQDGAIEVGNATTLDAGQDITLAHVGNRFGGNVRATAAGDITLRGDGALRVTHIDGGDDADVSLHAGALDLATAIDAGTGALTLRSDAGTLQVTHALGGGTVSLDGRDGVVLGAGVVARDALAMSSSGGAIRQQAGAIVAMGTTAIESAGDIALGGFNDFGGPVSLRGGNAVIRDVNALTLGTLALDTLDVTSQGALGLGQGQVDGAVTARSNGGGISQSGGLVFGGGTLDAGTGHITLDHAGNDVTGTLNLRGGTVAITDRNALTLGTVTAGALTAISQGALDLGQGQVAGALHARSNGGRIGQSGALMVAGTADIGAGGGDITLAHAGNDFRGSVLLAGHAVEIVDANALTLGAVDATSLEVTSHGALRFGSTDVDAQLRARSNGGVISQSGALGVGGAADFGAGTGSILLTHGNRFGGPVTLQGHAIDLHSAGDLHIVDLRSGPDAAVRVVAQRDLRLDGTPIDTGSAALFLLADTGTLHTATAIAGHEVTLAGRHGVVVDGDVTTAAGLVLASQTGDITQVSGTIEVGGDLQASTQSGDITLARSGNAFGGTLSLQGRNVEISGGDLDLASVAAGGALSLTGTGAITQQGAVRVAGTSRFDAVDGVRLDHVDNVFGGAVSLAGGAAALHHAGALTLGTLDVASLDVASQGALDLGSGRIDGALIARSNGGAITQSGALAVGGTADIAAGSGNVSLTSANTFGGPVVLQGHAIDLAAAADLHIADLRSGPDARVQVRVEGDLELDGSAIDTGSADLLLLANAGTLRTGTAVAGDAVVLAGRDGVTLGGDVTSAAGLVLASLDADITQQAGRLQVGGDLQASTGSGDLTLAQTGNRFDGTLSLQGGDIRVAGGDLDLAAVAAGGDLSLVGTGAITQQGAVRVAGTSDIAGAGGITLTRNDNAFGGAVSLTGGATTLHHADALTLGTLDVASLDVASNGALDLGSGRIGGALVARSNGGRIGQSGALMVAGTADIGAGGSDITLAHAGNDFRGSVLLAGDAVEIVDTNALTLGAVSARSVDIGAATIRLGSDVSTHGDQIWRGDMALAADVALDSSAGDILVTGRVDSNGGTARSLMATAGNGEVRFAQAIGRSNALADLTVSADKVTLGNTIDVNDGLAITTRADLILSADARAGGDIHVSTGGAFRNLAGATGLESRNGRWIVHMADIDGGHVFGGLDSGNAGLTGVGSPEAVLESGNRYAFGERPTLTLVTTDLRKTYGQTADLSRALRADGLLQDAAGAYRGHTLTDVIGTPSIRSEGASTAATVAGGPYAITIDDTSLSAFGYTLAVRNEGRLTVDPATLVIRANDANKPFGLGIDLDGYTVDGLRNADRVDDAALSSDGEALDARPGRYAIEIGDAVGQGLDNYAIAYIDGTLQVGTGTADAMGVARAVEAGRRSPAAPMAEDVPTGSPPIRIEGSGIRLPASAACEGAAAASAECGVTSAR